MPAPPDPTSPTVDPTPPLPCTSGADHLLIPWAVGLAEPCQQALAVFDAPGQLPQLQALLDGLSERTWLHGDEYLPTPPHERVLAALVGWPGSLPEDTGPAPWAALWAHLDGLAPAPGEAWGLMTPSHWLTGRDQLTMLHPAELALSEPESRALFEAVHPLFDSDGWHLAWGAPTRWYLRHDSLAGLPTASLDRVIGRGPDLWMPDHPQARLLRRLQSEVQMLLHQHPVNDEREARGALPVNSFWLSGTGTAPAAWPVWPIRPLARTQGPRLALLGDDLAAWQQAWRDLDAGPLRELREALDAGRAVRLTLCGERHALTLSTPAQAPGLWARLRRALPGARPHPRAADVLREL